MEHWGRFGGVGAAEAPWKESHGKHFTSSALSPTMHSRRFRLCFPAERRSYAGGVARLLRS